MREVAYLEIVRFEVNRTQDEYYSFHKGDPS